MERFSTPFHILLGIALRDCIVYVDGMWNRDAFYEVQEWITDTLESYYQTVDRFNRNTNNGMGT